MYGKSLKNKIKKVLEFKAFNKKNDTDQYIDSIDRDFDNLKLYLWQCINIWVVVKLEYFNISLHDIS